MKHRLPDAKKIVLIYSLAGLMWVLLLTGFVVLFEEATTRRVLLEVGKTGTFVLLTSILLYYLLTGYSRQIGNTVEGLASRQKQFVSLYKEMPQPIWIYSENGHALFMNGAASAISGKENPVIQEPMRQALNDVKNDAANTPRQAGTNYIQKGVQKLTSAEGTQLYLDLIIRKIKYFDKSAWLMIGVDVTKLIQAERDKRQIHNELVYYKKALDRSALLSITDVNGIILDVNTKFCEVSKYSREELIGNGYRKLNSGYHAPGFFRNMYEKIEQGEVWRNEICNRASDGHLFWVDTSVIPVLDESSQVHRYMAISYLITDRKAAEIKSERVHEELMRFMYKASHNLRGPVATISGLLNIARIEVRDSKLMGYLNMLSERTKHLEYTLSELIDITKVRQEELVFKNISFRTVLKSVLSNFTAEIEKFGVKVVQKICGCDGFNSDEKLVRGLLYYLIDNAIKFRSNLEPSIEISVHEKPNGVLITIADNGPGIDENIRSRIYEMYFRGNEKSTGSGLGLYIVSSIVERLNGYISLKSSKGGGAAFVIFLPDALYIAKLKKEEGTTTYLMDKRMPDISEG